MNKAERELKEERETVAQLEARIGMLEEECESMREANEDRIAIFMEMYENMKESRDWWREQFQKELERRLQ